MWFFKWGPFASSPSCPFLSSFYSIKKIGFCICKSISLSLFDKSFSFSSYLEKWIVNCLLYIFERLLWIDCFSFFDGVLVLMLRDVCILVQKCYGLKSIIIRRCCFGGNTPGASILLECHRALLKGASISFMKLYREARQF